MVFFDEPTAALGVIQTAMVLDLLRGIRDQGLGVVLISHSMPDVLAVADRIHVLRLGQNVRTYRGADTTTEELVGAMTGAVAPTTADKETKSAMNIGSTRLRLAFQRGILPLRESRRQVIWRRSVRSPVPTRFGYWLHCSSSSDICAQRTVHPQTSFDDLDRSRDPVGYRFGGFLSRPTR